jgi:hypothetical protein
MASFLSLSLLTLSLSLSHLSTHYFFNLISLLTLLVISLYINTRIFLVQVSTSLSLPTSLSLSLAYHLSLIPHYLIDIKIDHIYVQNMALHGTIIAWEGLDHWCLIRRVPPKRLYWLICHWELAILISQHFYFQSLTLHSCQNNFFLSFSAVW